MKKQFIIPLAVFLLLIFLTAGVILYGRGYRLSFGPGKTVISGTGLLVATSLPNGAQVFINGKLTTATDNTINLSPGTYKVKITKDGYFSWEKTIKVDKEIVSKAEALLFPLAPKLESLTDSGASTITVDPTGSRVAFVVASNSAKQNGIYVFDMTTKPIFIFQNNSKQLVDDTFDLFSQSVISWSPDATEILATVSAQIGTKTTYLLDSNASNQTPRDVTETLFAVGADWEKQQAKKDKSTTDGLKTKLKQLITENFSNPSWSADGNKALYVASRSASLPLIITPRLLGIDSTPEQRNIEKKSIYVYDTKEDKNYKVLLPEGAKTASWFADSKHIVYVANRQIHVMEFDGTNDTTIYAGPFVDSFVFPWSDGSKLVILTNLNNPQIPPNLYTIGLK